MKCGHIWTTWQTVTLPSASESCYGSGLHTHQHCTLILHTHQHWTLILHTHQHWTLILHTHQHWTLILHTHQHWTLILQLNHSINGGIFTNSLVTYRKRCKIPWAHSTHNKYTRLPYHRFCTAGYNHNAQLAGNHCNTCHMLYLWSVKARTTCTVYGPQLLNTKR